MGSVLLYGATDPPGRLLPILRGVEVALPDQRFTPTTLVVLAQEASSCGRLDARPEGRKL
jgi:hypothetical protein